MIAPGAVVAEKYWVERVLGKGGMGIVVAATHLTLGQRVALKFLKPEAARDGELVERFLREARAAARLRGEHVGKVIDVGTAEDGLPFIVMEYLEGHDLASALGRSGPLPVPIAVDYVLQACVGLVEAHAAGIVHRDLKPSNLFLTRRPDGSPLVKVLDFGIAKAVGHIDGAITESAAVMGSPGYMSPEQLRSARDVDHRADLWSLGVVLYELVCGRRPFAAQTITELAVVLATEPAPALTVPTPRGFAAVIKRCLEKDPERRFGSVAELAAALAPFGSPGAAAVAASIGRVHAGPPPAEVHSAVGALMGATTLTRATSVRVPGGGRGAGATQARQRRAIMAAAAASAVAVAAITVVVLSGGGGGAGSAAPDAMPAVAPPIAAGAPAIAPLAPLDGGVDDAGAGIVAEVPTAAPEASGAARGGSGRGAGGRRGGGAGEVGPVTMPTVDPTARPIGGAGSGSAAIAAPSGGSATPASGSATPTSGSATPASGGATPASGGAPPASGGATPASGGATPASGSGAAAGSAKGSAKPAGVPDDTDGDGIPDKR